MIVRRPYPQPLWVNNEDYVRQNVLIETGFLKTNELNQHASGNVLRGSIFQLGGTVYHATSDTAIAGVQSGYVKLVPNGDGSELDPEYVASLLGVTWNDRYNGYYDIGGNLYIFNEQILLRKGDMAIDLTHYDDLIKPAIVAESSVEINGGFYTNFAEVGIAGITANDTWYDILLIPAGRTFTASFVAKNSGVWAASKQGLYSGNNRVVGCVYQDGSGDFINKNILVVKNRTIEIIMNVGDWNMDTTASKEVAHNLPDYKKVRSIIVLINADVDINENDSFPAPSNNATSAEIITMDNVNVQMIRATTGVYDNTAYNATPYNRGFITIKYEV